MPLSPSSGSGSKIDQLQTSGFHAAFSSNIAVCMLAQQLA